MTATASTPLAIVSKHVGFTATRFSFNDRSYTVATDDGRTVCIAKACIDQRIADRCKHVEIVKALAPSEFDHIAQPEWSSR
jgi:hypothetical protein